MLKLGEKIISDIYLGDKKIAKVFLGDKLVFQSGKPIFLDYIEFDGASYIDTGILYPDGCDGTWTVKGKANMDGAFRVLLATKAVSGSYYGKGSNNKWGLGSTYCFDVNGDVLTEAQVVFKKNQVQATVDGVTLTRSATQSQSTIKLGGTNLASDLKNYFIGEVYGCKYVDINNNLIIDLRPCIHPNGTVCFYDTVTKKYFYNQGTGTLKAGGRFVESIVSDGNCYINTGIKASYDYTIKTKYMYTSFVGAYNCIFGTRNQAVSEGDKVYWVGCNVNSSKELMLRLGKSTSPYYLKVNEVIDLEITPNEAIINGTNLGDAMFDGEIGFDSSIYLFNINMNGDGSTALFASVARMYNFQIYNNNMELIQDLRPYVDADGVACFKDLVTNTLLYGQGTGKLEYTE